VVALMIVVFFVFINVHLARDPSVCWSSVDCLDSLLAPPNNLSLAPREAILYD
jgi:hypothetical protein